LHGVADLLDTLREALADRYDVQRELGRGGMATVFLAEDLKHHRSVAIKVLHAELAAQIGPERFVREIEIAARLQHPHILPLYDSGEAAGFLYYVMPLVEGESLRDRLDREHQLSQEDALRIATEVAGALSYAHSRGVVHRDIKPENILLSAGTAVVADFGIARALDAAGEHQLTQTGTIIGTPAYMSPEQATGSTEIDGRSDQYSLACVVYELLVGQPPFTGPTAQAIIARHSLDMVSPPSIVRDTIPDAVEDAILRALSKTPADRFPTAALFAEALHAPSATSGPRRRTTRSTTVPRRWLGLRAEVVLGIAALVLVAGGWATRRLWSGNARPPTTANGPAPEDIAVLYFDDQTRQHDAAYLADGLTEALIVELARVPRLHVISRNGVAPFRGADVSPDSVARALRVGTIVQGSVDETADRYRVSVRLIDGASGADFRRTSFEQPRGDLLRIRDTLAVKVADLLRELLGQEVRLREERAGTSNPAAWSLLQRADRAQKDARARSGAGDAAAAGALYGQADSLLDAAAQADGRWLDPLVARARVAFLRAALEREPRDKDRYYQAGLGYAERAIALDPQSPDALEIRGTIRFNRFARGLEPDPQAAERLLAQARADLESATRFNPNQAGAWAVLSQLYYSLPDRIEANRAARAAYEADAYLTNADAILYRLWVTSYDLELFQPALEWCDKGRGRFPRDPRFVECRLMLLSTPVLDPDVPEAWRLASAAVTLTPERDQRAKQLQEQIWVAAVLGRAGLKDSAHHVLDRSRGTPEVDPGRELLALQAVVRIMLGEKDVALRDLSEALIANPRHRDGFKKAVHWWWRPLQGDPGFKALVGAR
jgi:eukaryotic-like serine/threonine-protein kinase